MFVPEIEARHISKEFSDARSKTRILDDISFSISEHEFVCVLGPSGCGKSTLLRIIAGLEEASRGKALFRGREITGPNPKTSAMIFQTFALLPWRTVYENIELGLQSIGIPKEKRKPAVMKYIKLMELDDFADAYPYELSGGMKQRVAIARALANDPDVLLMDEPFAALDAQTRELMQEELLKVWEATKKTVLFITHSIEEAVYLSSDIAVMTYRPGKLKRLFGVSLPHPRYDYNIRTAPEFLQLKLAIHELVREEIVKHTVEES